MATLFCFFFCYILFVFVLKYFLIFSSRWHHFECVNCKQNRNKVFHCIAMWLFIVILTPLFTHTHINMYIYLYKHVYIYICLPCHSIHSFALLTLICWPPSSWQYFCPSAYGNPIDHVQSCQWAAKFLLNINS